MPELISAPHLRQLSHPPVLIAVHQVAIFLQVAVIPVASAVAILVVSAVTPAVVHSKKSLR